MAVKRKRTMRYEVNHSGTSNGPKFSSLTEALAYINHCMKNGNSFMSIHKI